MRTQACTDGNGGANEPRSYGRSDYPSRRGIHLSENPKDLEVSLTTTPTFWIVQAATRLPDRAAEERAKAAGASQVPASQNSAPVISLTPAKFRLKGLQFRLDLIKMTVALNRALRII
jgi:hypothetical protein